MDRRSAAAWGAVLLGGAVVGGLVTTAHPAPEVIRVSLGGGAAGARPAAAEAGSPVATTDLTLAPGWRVEYVLAGDLPALADPAGAWVARGAVGSAADALRIAQAFGVPGEPVPAQWGEGWVVGAADGSAASVSLTVGPLGDWWYAAAPQAVAGCAEPVPPLEDPAAGGPDRCAAPAPVTDLPADDEARSRALALAAQVGGWVGDDVRVTRDEWGVSVELRTRLGGVAAPYWGSVRFGAGRQVESANGFLGRFEAAGQYPRIGTAEAFARLQRGQALPWLPALGASSGERPVDSGALDETAAAPDPPAVSAPVPPLEEDPALTTVQRVQVSGVEPDLWILSGVDGEVWLVPAYRFLSVDGGERPVLAVPDGLVEVVSPHPLPPAPEPVPVEPVPVEPAPVEPAPEEPAPEEPGVPTPYPLVDPATVVGLSEAAATAWAQQQGIPSRVVSRDAEALAVTSDYRPERLNLGVADGTVVEAYLG